MGRIKVLSVFGTRPDTIKLAPVVAELSRHPEKICSVTVGTAQHRDMMDQVLAVFGISPDYDLGSCKTTSLFSTLQSEACADLRKCFFVRSLTSPLFMETLPQPLPGALASFYCRTEVGHVEAGLRTGHKFDPFRRR